MSGIQALGRMCNARDVEIAEALRNVVEQFNRIGRDVGEAATGTEQQEFLVMIAPLVATELRRLTDEHAEGMTGSSVGGLEDVVPGWNLLVTAADEVVVRSPEGGPGGMTIPAEGGPLSVCILRDLVKALVRGGGACGFGFDQLGATKTNAHAEIVTARRA